MRYRFFLVITLCFLFPLLGFSSTIHGIVIVDEDTLDIKKGCEEDKKNIKKYLQRIEKSFKKKKLQLNTFRSQKISKKEIINFLNNLHSKPDDIIFFYYSGHGSWEEKKGLIFHLKNRERVYFDQVKNILKNKQARFKMLVTDCCKAGSYSRSKGDRFPIVLPTNDFGIDKNFRTLFSSTAFIIAMSCKDGEISYSDKDGGFFTYHLLQAISRYVEDYGPDWDGITQKAIYDTSNYVKTKHYLDQIPDIFLEIKKP